MAKFFKFFVSAALVLSLTSATGRGRGHIRVKKEVEEKTPTATDKPGPTSFKRNPTRKAREQTTTRTRREKNAPVKDDLSMWGYFDSGVKTATALRAARTRTQVQPTTTLVAPETPSINEIEEIKCDTLVSEPSSSSSTAEYVPTLADLYFERIIAEYDNQRFSEDDDLFATLFPDYTSDLPFDFPVPYYAADMSMESFGF